jgi:hypothetical protein
MIKFTIENKMYTFALCNFEKRKEEKGRKEGITVRLFVTK